ncbi:TIR domain-containing protein [Anaerolineae bacterium CFX8]|nr:TIR domain-containing protein [Anaerolineae bacterium CFX8]
MPQVFISYKRDYSISLALLIREKLKQQNIDVFVDVTKTDSVGTFPKHLKKELENSDIFICILGYNTLASRWVNIEIQHAYEHKKPMIPVFQEAFVEPSGDCEPHVQQLLEHQGVHILDQRGLYIDNAIDVLIKMVKRYLDTDGSSSLKPIPIPFTPLGGIPIVPPADPSATSDIEPAPSPLETPPQPLLSPKPKRRLTASIIIAVFVFGIAGIVGIAAIRGMVENTQTAATETAAALLADSSSTPTYTPSETPTASPTPQPTNTPHPTDTDTLSPTVTPTSTPTRAPSATFTDAPTATYTPAPTLTFTLMPTLTPSIQVIVPPPTETDAPVFLVDPFEATNKQYKACVQAQKCSPPSNQRRLYDLSFDSEPVVYVSWRMASDYCIYSGGRLPTEDEWITASRHDRGLGGRVSEWVGSQDESPEIAITRGNGRDTPERMELNPQITSDVIGFRCGRYGSP